MLPKKAGFDAIEYMSALSGREDCLLHSYQVIKEKCQQINVMATPLNDKITYTVGFVICLLSVPLACLGCRVMGHRAGTPVEFSENRLQNLPYK